MKSLITSGKSLKHMDRDGAESLLDDVLHSEETQLTEEMIEEAGGRESIINEISQ